MNENKTLLDGVAEDVMEPVLTRRAALGRGAQASGGLAYALAIGSVPLALAALTRDVYGQSPAEIRAVLEFAFLLENLEAEFYKAVLGESSAAAFNVAFAPVRSQLTASERATFQLIRQHEVAHVAFLRQQIIALGGTPANYTATSFDFTGGNGSGTGPFAAATTNKGFLLAAAQAFEDTGVRAYKGQAGNLMSNDAVLEAALRIHSVEARHAAKIRKMRAEAGATVPPSGTIRRSQSGITGVPAPGQAVVEMIYAGATPESNTSHVVFNGTAAATLDAASLAGIAQFGGVDAVTEAFDEPLTKAEVTAIIAPFVVGDNP